MREIKDYEGQMIKSQLAKIEKIANRLNAMVQESDEFEAWVQSKISEASKSLGDVYDYLDYQLNMGKYGKGGRIGKYRFDITGDIYDLKRDGQYVIMEKNKKPYSVFGISKFNSLVDEGKLKKIGVDGLKVESGDLDRDMEEVRNIIGDDYWKLMSKDERVNLRNIFYEEGLLTDSSTIENILIKNGFERERGGIGFKRYRKADCIVEVGKGSIIIQTKDGEHNLQMVSTELINFINKNNI